MLRAIYKIRGVKVVAGRGKGGNQAYPGDLFETDPASEKSLLEGGSAELPDAKKKDNELKHKGPDIESVAERALDGAFDGYKAEEEPEEVEAPVEAPAKKASKGKAAKAQKEQPAADDAFLEDDLGLTE